MIVGHILRGVEGFNPRPLLLTGESFSSSSSASFPSLFQSTPVIANGRIHLYQEGMRSFIMFQSTPVIANGRILTCTSGMRTQASFNPRPLLLTGESSVEAMEPEKSISFNPRPLLLTGESESNPRPTRIHFVSIHARYC